MMTKTCRIVVGVAGLVLQASAYNWQTAGAQPYKYHGVDNEEVGDEHHHEPMTPEQQKVFDQHKQKLLENVPASLLPMFHLKNNQDMPGLEKQLQELKIHNDEELTENLKAFDLDLDNNDSIDKFKAKFGGGGGFPGPNTTDMGMNAGASQNSPPPLPEMLDMFNGNAGQNGGNFNLQDMFGQMNGNGQNGGFDLQNLMKNFGNGQNGAFDMQNLMQNFGNGQNGGFDVQNMMKNFGNGQNGGFNFQDMFGGDDDGEFGRDFGTKAGDGFSPQEEQAHTYQPEM